MVTNWNGKFASVTVSPTGITVSVPFAGAPKYLENAAYREAISDVDRALLVGMGAGRGWTVRRPRDGSDAPPGVLWRVFGAREVGRAIAAARSELEALGYLVLEVIDARHADLPAGFCQVLALFSRGVA